MSESSEPKFQMRGRYYKANAIGAVVQVDADTVEVRYLDGAKNKIIHGATVERVMYAIEQAKDDADSD